MIQDKILGKIKEIIGFEQFDNITILIETDGKLSDGITLKKVAILLICSIKDDNKFYSRLFLQEALL